MRTTNTANIAHSWDLESWPSSVYPHTTSRAKYLVRAHRDSLIASGVLTRVGRELVVFGTQYSRWLEQRRVNVPEFSNGAARTKQSQRAA